MRTTSPTCATRPCPAAGNRSASRSPQETPFGPPPASGSKLTAPWPGLDKIMGRLANYIAMGNAALLVVDQVEDLAAMHRARLTTVLGMLKALAARSGAAVIALTHNPASNYPRAVTAMQHRLALASVVFTTTVIGSGDRRFLVPLRPAMSDDALAIPFVLPPADDFAVALAQARVLCLSIDRKACGSRGQSIWKQPRRNKYQHGAETTDVPSLADQEQV